MTKSTTADPHATAFHEAGHAVMAYLQRVTFKQVIIVADADSVGHVILGKWPDWQTRNRATTASGLHSIGFNAESV